MTRTTGFSPKRCLLLIKNELFLNRSYIMIAAAAICVLLTLLSMRDIISPLLPLFYQKYYFIILFISGIVVYGKMFKDLHHETNGCSWLTMPASILEKLVSRILLSTVVLMVAVMAIVFFSSLLSAGINLLLFGSRHDIFNPFGKGIISKTVEYFIILSPFFLGAIYFKKSALFKTFLSISAYILMIMVIILFTMRIVFDISFYNLIYGFDPVGKFSAFVSHLDKIEAIWSVTNWVLKLMFWWFLAPLCWVIGYFRLKETEI